MSILIKKEPQFQELWETQGLEVKLTTSMQFFFRNSQIKYFNRWPKELT